MSENLTKDEYCPICGSNNIIEESYPSKNYYERRCDECGFKASGKYAIMINCWEKGIPCFK